MRVGIDEPPDEKPIPRIQRVVRSQGAAQSRLRRGAESPEAELFLQFYFDLTVSRRGHLVAGEIIRFVFRPLDRSDPGVVRLRPAELAIQRHPQRPTQCPTLLFIGDVLQHAIDFRPDEGFARLDRSVGRA
jgi:hypothetical protein